MSLYGAIMTGISGLNAQSQALSVTSANIANVKSLTANLCMHLSCLSGSAILHRSLSI